MQEVIFVSHHKGVGKTSNKEYDFVRLSNGIEAFTVGNPKAIDFSDFKEGDNCKVELEVKKNSRGEGLEANIVDITNVS